jgi:hypothetical protein
MNLYQYRKQQEEVEKIVLRNLAIKVGIIKPKRTVKDLYYECVVKPNLGRKEVKQNVE